MLTQHWGAEPPNRLRGVSNVQKKLQMWENVKQKPLMSTLSTNTKCIPSIQKKSVPNVKKSPGNWTLKLPLQKGTHRIIWGYKTHTPHLGNISLRLPRKRLGYARPARPLGAVRHRRGTHTPHSNALRNPRKWMGDFPELVGDFPQRTSKTSGLFKGSATYRL